jgi:predicted transcriptional regulator
MPNFSHALNRRLSALAQRRGERRFLILDRPVEDEDLQAGLDLELGPEATPEEWDAEWAARDR